MADQNREVLSSSPDALTEDYHVSRRSPKRARSLQPLTPQKRVFNDNAQDSIKVQDIQVKTPVTTVSHFSTPSRHGKANGTIASPWRIRVTVEAEQNEEEQPQKKRRKPSKSPSKKLIENTVTTTIPLKGGDESHVQAKRGRGRPRKSVGTPVKRAGTPKPRMNRNNSQPSDRKNTINHPPSEDMHPDSTTLEKKKSDNQFVSGHGSFADPDSEDTVDNIPKSKASPSALSQSRQKATRKRKSPAHVEIAADPDHAHSDEHPSGLAESRISSLDLTRAQEGRFTRLPFSPVTSQRARRISLADKQSPGKNLSRQTQVDMEFDSIIESEGFSAVSLNSLTSTKDSRKIQQIPLGKRHSDVQRSEQYPIDSNLPKLHTYGIKEMNSIGEAGLESMDSAVPREEAPLDCPTKQVSSLRGLDYQDLENDPPTQPVNDPDNSRLETTPSNHTLKLARVVRAGIALQGVLDPRDGEKVNNVLERERHTSNSKIQMERFEDMFIGFDSHTRRELRAGLRFGEELAKRQREAAQNARASRGRKPSSSIDTRGETGGIHKSFVKSMSIEPMRPDDVHYPNNSASNKSGLGDKLNNPDAGNAHSDWRHRECALDTPAARAAEWQKEREAVSRQIQEADESRIITIESKDPTINFDDNNSGDGSEGEQTDIWQAEAMSSLELKKSSSSASQQQPASSVLARRATLPSPWRARNRTSNTSQHVTGIHTPRGNGSQFDPSPHLAEIEDLQEEKVSRHRPESDPGFQHGQRLDSKESSSPGPAPAEIPPSVEKRVRKNLLGDGYTDDIRTSQKPSAQVLHPIQNPTLPELESMNIKSEEYCDEQEIRTGYPADLTTSPTVKEDERVAESSAPGWLILIKGAAQRITKSSMRLPLQVISELSPWGGVRYPSAWVDPNNIPPFTKHKPWTWTHWAMLCMIYEEAQEATSLWRCRRSSRCAHMIGQKLYCRDWVKTMEEWHMAVADEFLAQLDHYGEDNRVIWKGDLIDEKLVEKKIFGLWYGQVQRNEINATDGVVGGFEEEHQGNREIVLRNQRLWKEYNEQGEL